MSGVLGAEALGRDGDVASVRPPGLALGRAKGEGDRGGGFGRKLLVLLLLLLALLALLALVVLVVLVVLILLLVLHVLLLLPATPRPSL